LYWFSFEGAFRDLNKIWDDCSALSLVIPLQIFFSS